MRSEQILQADILDIIFDNRNKDYGAYTLRKYYQNRMMRSLGVMMLFVSMFSFFIFLPVEKSKKKEDIITQPAYIPPVVQEPAKKNHEKEKNQRPVSKKSQTKSRGAIIKIVADKIKTDTISTGFDQQAGLIAGGEISPTGGTEGNSTLILPTAVNQEEMPGISKPDLTRVYHNVDILPSFPGGNNALARFLKSNLVTPGNIEQGEIITVRVSFIVGYDGVLKSFEVIEDGGAVFNQEVLRVLKKMPAWIPGKAAGNNVSVYFNIPVKFMSQEYNGE